MIEVPFGSPYNGEMVAALGFFDCMHKGHYSLLQKARAMANGAECALFTFDNNPLLLLRGEERTIYTYPERLYLYERAGVDVLLHARFDEVFMSGSAESFLSQWLSYRLKGVVCGFDYTCGSDRRDSRFVRDFFAKRGIPCEIVPEMTENGEKISSRLVRRCLARNDVRAANALTIFPYFFRGTVVSGRGIGHTIGFPTANVTCGENKLLPRGVFCAETTRNGQNYPSVVNIGPLPTFDICRESAEVYLIGFEGTLYGQEICVTLYDRLRETKKFDDAKALARQLQKDVADTLRYLHGRKEEDR